MKTKHPSPEKNDSTPIDRHLSLGTSQNITQAGDGTARPAQANNKEDDPSMQKEKSAEQGTAKKRGRKR